MSVALQKYFAAGLSGLFFLAATGAPSAEAAPHSPKKSGNRVTTPVKHKASTNNACIQTASETFARSVGYSSLNVMRRASALAYLRTERGEDNAIIDGIALANKDTGADFNLLMMIASSESRLGAEETPLYNSSRAVGPFQYLPAPFLTLFNWFGADYAGGLYACPAARIKFDEQKNPSTDDPALTSQILSLRSDRYVSSYIKGVEIMKDVKPLLRAVLGREPSSSDIHVSHIIGLEQEKALLRALRNNPKAPAADVFPLEASKEDNSSLFYKKGKKLTIQQFYKNLSARTASHTRKINDLVLEGLAAKSCLPPRILVRPDPVIIAVPDSAPASTPPQPSAPVENMPAEPEVFTNPASPAAPQPAPASLPQWHAPAQVGPGGNGP